MMTAAFLLKGLDCAHCAAKIERAVGKLKGVESASVNFMTTKMSLNIDEACAADIIREAEAIVKKYEPDVVMKKV